MGVVLQEVRRRRSLMEEPAHGPTGFDRMLPAVLALALVVVHLFAGRLQLVGHLSRSTWLSAAGGIAVAYVFLHVLPDLVAHERKLGQATDLAPEQAQELLFLSALIGLIVFYGMERIAPARAETGSGNATSAEAALFWAHLGSFALYNLLIGYLLVQREMQDTPSLLLYFIAVATHFIAIDASLRRHHQARYDHIGRWIVASAILAGWALAHVVQLPQMVTSLMFAFLAGGIVLNVLKEELPQERRGRFLPFLLGALAYSVILIAI